jgi:hypothetical protein
MFDVAAEPSYALRRFVFSLCHSDAKIGLTDLVIR